MWNAGLDEAQAGIRITGRNINNLRYADDTTLMANKWRTKEPFDKKWKRRVKKAGLKLNIQKTDHGIWSHHFMANRWGNSGNSDRLYFLGLQNHCRWWLQLWNYKTLAPCKKSYHQPRQRIQRQRYYFANKGPYSQSCGFSSGLVWMWELDHKESWALKIVLLSCGVGEDLRVPWTARRSNQSILKEITTEYSLEGLMLKLKLQYFGHLMQRTELLEKTVMLGKIEGRRRRDDRGWDGWMASPMRWPWVWIGSRSWWWTAKPGLLQSMVSQRVRHDWATELRGETGL